MSYAVVVTRRFNVTVNGRAFNRELGKCLELPVPPAPDLFLDFDDGSGTAQIDHVTVRARRGAVGGFVRPMLDARCRTERAEVLELALAAGWVDVAEAVRAALSET